MERIDTPNGRYYRVFSPTREAEIMVPSVTTILGVIAKPQIATWGLRECCRYVRESLPQDRPVDGATLEGVLRTAMVQPKERLDAAGQFGTAMHSLAEAYMTQGQEPHRGSLPPRERAWFERFRTWWDDSGLTCLLAEHFCWSDEFLYAGTMDCLASDSRNLYVVDLKTSGSLAGAPSYLLQAAAYRAAMIENAGLVAALCADELAQANLLVVRVGRNGGATDVLQVNAQDADQLFHSYFLAARALYHWTEEAPKIVRNARCSFQAVPTLRATPSRG